MIEALNSSPSISPGEAGEHALTFPNAAGETLVGVLHLPQRTPRAAMVMLHGWSGYRTGPHQMLTRAARAFCAQGCAVLRFDFAGRGDSEGDTNLATLATMRADTEAATRLLRQHTDAPLWLLGLCSGCEIALAATGDEVSGVILWSAPVFAALPSEERQAKKGADNLKKYARKLLQPSTYLKVLRGDVDTKAVSKALAGGGGAASKNRESNEPGQLPPGFRDASLRRWKAFRGPVFQVYGTADPIQAEAQAWYATQGATAPQVHLVAGANHSFYGLVWEREVIDVTLRWFGNTTASRSHLG